MKKSGIKAVAVLLSMVMLAGCSQGAKQEAQTTAAATEAEKEESKAEENKAEEGKAEGGQTADGTVTAPDGYPSKNISWIVPADAGAPLDIPTRAIIDNMKIDTNVIVENIAGASNTIGTLETVNRPGDGYTILTGSSSSMILQPLMVDLAYDPADLRILTLVKPFMTYAVVVSPDSKLKTADDWMALLKSGERFTYSVSNAGSASHLSVVDTLKQLGIESGVYVPYNGGSEVSAALLNNEIDFAVLDTSDQLKKSANGDVNVLLIMSDEPDPLAPEIPVIADYGVTGMDVYFSLQCVAVRKDTPDDIAAYLKQQINEAIQSEAYQKYLVESGVGEMDVIPEEEIEDTVSRARETYASLLKELNMIQQ